MRIKKFRRIINTITEGEGDAGGSGVDGDGEGAGTTQESEGASQPKTYTQEEVNAIVERRLAKERSKHESEERQDGQLEKRLREAEDRAKEAEEKGYARGQLEAKRNQVAELYGIDATLLPDTEEKLAEFEKQMNTTITNRRRVLPVEVTDKTSTPPWVGAVSV